MKKRKFDGNDSKQVLIGMITNGAFLGRVAAKGNRDLFAGDSERWIASICVKYFQRYGEAPGKQIQSLFMEEAKKQERFHR